MVQEHHRDSTTAARNEEPAGNFSLGERDEPDTLPFMANPEDARRRWLGLFCLTLAAGLLIWGQTVLKPHLEGFWFLFYWAACFLLTCSAIVIALLDMRAMRRRIMEERRDLLKRTLEEIEKERAKKAAREDDGLKS